MNFDLATCSKEITPIKNKAMSKVVTPVIFARSLLNVLTLIVLVQ